MINIGQSVAKYLKDKDKIKYYAQELKENTYSLTRMNLVMRGIKPENIVARCGDTLEDDWPYFDEGDKENSYFTLWVDAVVSNPPYSQNWTPHEDPRFADYGIAPKSKADFAFLLHDLYHLKDDGIMTIVLPHGVLFRGGEEGEIRKNLVENDNIDTIIGLPANIFFGTGIPTIIMVLKKKRDNNDILIVDASKGFVKEGKNNKLRPCDIKKIVDTVIKRESINKYSKVVSKDEIRKNDYNLNIPRYVDSSEKAESYDLYATMFGGIPNSEIDELKDYWDSFPTLKDQLFKSNNTNFSRINTEDVKNTILTNDDVNKFEKVYKLNFEDFNLFLRSILIDNYKNLNIPTGEETISLNIFERLKNISLIDKYQAYEILAEAWTDISTDLEVLQTEGESALNKVDPIMVIKKNKTTKKDEEVQDGWRGHVLPFELVQKEILSEQKNKIVSLNNRLQEITSLYEEKLENLSEDDKSEISDDLSDENDSFVNSQVSKHAKELRKRKNSLSEVEKVVCEVADLIDEEKTIKRDLKSLESKLDSDTKKTIESLPINFAFDLLAKKWIDPLFKDINDLPISIVDSLTKEVPKLSKKYETTFLDIDSKISQTEKELSAMLDDLVADEDDLKGLMELKKLLGGE